MAKMIDIRNKYSIEVTDIENKLCQIKDKLTDEQLKNQIEQIYVMLEELREKIEYNKISDVEILQRYYEEAMAKRGW